ncbi:AAA family ATPase [Amycolatopsis sp. NPDC049688]|uniref:AAA family ATPase n=1 Tax=Amycolatopsis sp. NPDC049688 TaxID=3154733 RepID=UPI00342FEC05
MPLVWVTGNAGAGKSAVCALLKEWGEFAVDADEEGYHHWADRTTGQVVTDPPDPVPSGWLDRFGWRIDRAKVESLAARTAGGIAYFCGCPENHEDVRDLFDLVICLVIDEDTLRHRLRTRTSNSFGKHPEELAAALGDNAYRHPGATIVDGTRPLTEVAGAILAEAARVLPRRDARGSS